MPMSLRSGDERIANDRKNISLFILARSGGHFVNPFRLIALSLLWEFYRGHRRNFDSKYSRR